jgi:hypothetical protein
MFYIFKIRVYTDHNKEMNQLFSSSDLITNLVQFCLLEDIAYLRSCNKQLKLLLESPVIVSILSPRNVNYTDLIQTHLLSFEDNMDKQLIQAIQTNDTERIKYILDRYPDDRTKVYDYDFYQMFFIAGCNNSEICYQLLDNANFQNWLGNRMQFMAGQVYSGINCDLTGLSDTRLALILFEAIRGGNKSVMEYIKTIFVNKSFLAHALMLGAAAANDLKTVQSYANCFNHLTVYEIPVIEDVGHLGLFEEPTNHTTLILFALYYNSVDTLDYLLRDRELDECFADDLIWSDKEPRIYSWINERLPFSDDSNRNLLWNAANADNLPLVKVLKRYIALHEIPEQLNEIVKCNAYRVMAWLIRKYGDRIESFDETTSDSLKDDHNRAACLVKAYLKKRG